jgi:hypothetical protein
MIVRSLSVAVALVVLCAAPVPAQQPETVQPTGATPQPIDPDRPDVTNGTHIVDTGLLQVEFGGVFSRANAAVQNLGTPVTFRFGATEWLELRFGGDGFLHSTDLTGQQQGMGNTQLGAKLRLWADPGGIPVVSILPTINMPTASATKGLGSGESDFTIAFLTGTDLFTRGHVDVNYGIGLIGTGPNLPRFTQHLVSVSASAEIPGPFTPYVESYWISRQEVDGRRVVALDTGGIYQISPRYAFDGGVQAGLTADAPAFSAFAGFSAIIGNITGEHGVHARQRQSARRRAAASRAGH